MPKTKKKTPAPATQAAPKGTRTKLPVEDYWKFQAYRKEISSIELEAIQASMEFKRRIHEATDRTRALFEQLGKAHGFDTKKHYGWDDATCELIEIVT